jgi:hypothetical protein
VSGGLASSKRSSSPSLEAESVILRYVYLVASGSNIELRSRGDRIVEDVVVTKRLRFRTVPAQGDRERSGPG